MKRHPSRLTLFVTLSNLWTVAFTRPPSQTKGAQDTMKTACVRLVALTMALIASGAQAQGARPGPFPTNLAIGTGGGLTSPGNLFPGATRPFGFVRLSPDSGSLSGDRVVPKKTNIGSSGYSHGDSGVIGFSHTRLSGTGVREGGAIRVSPEFAYAPGMNSPLRLDHNQEKIEPGYYSIHFAEAQLLAEMTATAHCGIHRYSVQGPGGSLGLRVDPDSALWSNGKPKSIPTTSGASANGFWISVQQQGAFSSRYGGYVLHAVGEFSVLPISRAEHFYQFAPTVRQVELKLCLSTVSLENAKANLANEIGDKNFSDIASEAVSEWNQWLSRGQIVTRNKEIATVYYTALYHSLIQPTNFTDSNNQYLGFDQKVQTANGFKFLTDMSLWDTFRTTHPLYSLIAPEIQCDSVKSLLAMGQQSGMLPRWPSGSGESGSMFGSPANFVIAETYFKQICPFDAQAALALMVKSANNVESHRSSRNVECLKHGYCPSDVIKGSVSKTLEYAWADSATAAFAKALGQSAIAESFSEKAQAFQKIWNPEIKYFAPKDSQGNFKSIDPNTIPYLDPFKKAEAFVEGSANQWRYTVPHAPQELIKMFGGPEAFVQELDAFMKDHSSHRSNLNPGGGYWHGNQHDLHVAYLFNEAGRSDLTQKWVRWILTDRYGNAPDGLGGNDDGGTLSAWFVLSAVGLYPMAGTDKYWLGAPIVDEANWNLSDGKTLKVIAHDQGTKNLYVKKVLLNGKPVCKPTISHRELSNGTLEFFMTERAQAGGGFSCDN